MSQQSPHGPQVEVTGTQANPFAAPAAARVSSASGLLERTAPWQWIAACVLVPAVYTLGLIYADSVSMAADSGPLVMFGSGGFWFFVCLLAGRTFLWKKAVWLSLACGAAIWLTVGVSATFAVPWLLNGSVGPDLFPFLAKIYLVGAIFAPAVSLLTGLKRRRTA